MSTKYGEITISGFIFNKLGSKERKHPFRIRNSSACYFPVESVCQDKERK